MSASWFNRGGNDVRKQNAQDARRTGLDPVASEDRAALRRDSIVRSRWNVFSAGAGDASTAGADGTEGEVTTNSAGRVAHRAGRLIVGFVHYRRAASRLVPRYKQHSAAAAWLTLARAAAFNTST